MKDKSKVVDLGNGLVNVYGANGWLLGTMSKETWKKMVKMAKKKESTN